MNRILVTNDDGIEAIGIARLVEALSETSEVYVFAPLRQQSAKSHSLTISQDVAVEQRDMNGAALAYAIDGTPVDCVKIGIRMLRDIGKEPDYVMSGINLGLNTGLATYYSGTVAGAREGVLNGIPSLALSVEGHEATEFRYMIDMLPRLMELTKELEAGSLLNVNVPALAPGEVKGDKVVPAAPFGYGILFDFHPVAGQISDQGSVPHGMYRLGDSQGCTCDEPRYDFDWIFRGYATISPIPTTLQDPVSLARLRDMIAPTDKP